MAFRPPRWDAAEGNYGMEISKQETEGQRNERYERLCVAVKGCKAAEVFFKISRSRRLGYRLTDPTPEMEPAAEALQQDLSPAPAPREMHG